MVNPLSNPGYFLPPLIVLGMSLALIAIVLRGTGRTSSSYLFSGLLLCIGLWGFIIFGMRSSADIHRAVLWDRAVVPMVFATFVFYYHFTLAYTRRTGYKGILFVGYLTTLAAIALIPTELVVEKMRVESYGYAPVSGPLSIPMTVLGTLLMGGGVYNLVRGYRASPSREEKNRLAYLILAIVFPLVGGFLDAFSNLPPLSIWANLAFSIVCTVAIVKYRLLDIRIVVRKGLVYLLVSGAMAIPYVAILYATQFFFRPAPQGWWVHALLILLLAAILRPLYTWAQHFADRLFYRHRYDQLRALEQFIHKAHSVTNLNELGSSMVNLISSALYVSHVSLLLSSETKHGLIMECSTGLEHSMSGLVLRMDSPLVRWLDQYGQILSSEELDIIPQLQSFSHKEKMKLAEMEAALYAPIKGRNGKLFGLLVLGRKLSEQSYTDEDKQLLAAVSNQLAIAIENAWLYAETRRSEEKLSLMYESMSQGVAILDLEANIIQLNTAILNMCGFKGKEELLGSSLLELVAKDARANTKKHLTSALKNGNAAKTEFMFLRRDGTSFPGELSAAVLRDATPSPMGFVVVIEDVTARNQAAEREKRLQQELNVSSRLASIGELAAGVAHEINNPLTGIIGFAQRRLRKTREDETKRDLKTIYEEASRAAQVVENLRTFARRRDPKKELVNLLDILNKALEMRMYELKTGNIAVVTNVAPGLPKVMVDFHQIQQVFLNIIMNAEQAMTEANKGGTLRITARKTEGHLVVRFADNGPGIARGDLERIFDPFFTTREHKGGTGLGLSICHGIVTEHGGKIYAESKYGHGTTLVVELPIA